MAALSIQVPYPVFYDRDGQPLDNGNIYIGVANLDPVTNPLQVYYDDALTITASQPLKTSNGYVYRNGTPAQLYVNSTDFSITVNDSKNLFVYSFPEATGIGVGANSIEYDPPFTGAVTSGYTIADKLEQTVSVKDFGAVGDGIADDTAAIQAAINGVSTTASSLGRASGVEIFFPTGTYKTTAPLVVDQKNVLFSGDNSIIQYTGADQAFLIGNVAYLTDFAIGYYTVGFSRLYINLTNAAATGILNNGYRNLYISECYVRGGNVGFETEGCFGGCLVENTFFQLQATYGAHIKQRSNLTQFRNGACLSGGTNGIRVSSVAGENEDITFINWDVEGFDIGYNLVGGFIGAVRFLNCRAESNVNHSILVDNTASGLMQNVEITGGWVDKPIQFGVSGGLGLIRGCSINSVQMSSANIIVNTSTGVTVGNEVIYGGTSVLTFASAQPLAASDRVTSAQIMQRYQIGAGTPFGISDTRGIIGDLRWDGTFAYIKNASNSWGRFQIGKFTTPTIPPLPTGATPSVTGCHIVGSSNVSPTSITSLTNGFAGQEIVLIGFDGGNTTLANGANIKLPGGASIVLGDNDAVTLVCVNETIPLWVCSSYANNP